MNTTTGLAAAFSLKTIVTTVVSLGVAPVVAVGGYSVASNYILFPEFSEALQNTLEVKNEPLTEFDTQKFATEGKTELSIEVPELNLDGTLSLSHSEKALQAALKTCGETFTVSYEDLNIAVAADGFNKGEAYGISLKNLRKNIMDSIFAANSGTDYEIDMETINEVCDVVERITEPKEMNKEYERAYEYLTKVFEKSEMAKDAQISYSKMEVLGEERSGRSQTLTINQEYVVKLLEDYAEALDSAKGKDLDALEYVLDDISTTLESADVDFDIDLDDLVDALEEAADTVEDMEELEDLEIKFSVCYVEKYLSAVVASIEYKNNDIETNIKACVTVDFGAKPDKTHEIIFNVSLGGSVDDEKAEMFAEVVSNAEKDGDRIVYTLTLEAEAQIPGQDDLAASGEAKIVLDNDKKEATMAVTANYAGKDVDIFSAEYDYSDSKDKLSLTPTSISIMGEEYDISCEVTLTLYRKPDKIKASKYTDILDMKEGEFDDLLKDLEDYSEELTEDFIDWCDALEDIGDVFDDLGDSAIAVPDYDDDYSYGYGF